MRFRTSAGGTEPHQLRSASVSSLGKRETTLLGLVRGRLEWGFLIVGSPFSPSSGTLWPCAEPRSGSASIRTPSPPIVKGSPSICWRCRIHVTGREDEEIAAEPPRPLVGTDRFDACEGRGLLAEVNQHHVAGHRRAEPPHVVAEAQQ